MQGNIKLQNAGKFSQWGSAPLAQGDQTFRFGPVLCTGFATLGSATCNRFPVGKNPDMNSQRSSWRPPFEFYLQENLMAMSQWRHDEYH